MIRLHKRISILPVATAILCFHALPGRCGEQTAWRATAENPPLVAIEADSPEPVAFAAAELRRYLGDILGVELPAVSTSTETTPDRPVIHLAVNKTAGLGEEGYELRSDGNTFRITGGGPSGVVYGGYEFLRRYGGCRFADLGPDGEHVPRKTCIRADAAPLRMKPKLWYRGLQFSFFEDPQLARWRIDWMAKNGMNYVMYMPVPDGADPKSVVMIDAETGEEHKPAKCEVYWRFTKGWFDKVLRPEIRRRGMKLDMNHHNLLYWLPRDRYFKDHPEWYALVDGRRGGGFRQLCICTGNREAVDTLIENVRKYLRENPEVKVLGIIPQDHMGMCQCAKCVAGDPDPKDAFRQTTWVTGNRSKSLRYAKLLNAVAAAIHGEFPDVVVGGEAYHDLLWPPRGVELDPMTTIWMAVHMRDGSKAIGPESGSKNNADIYNILKQWRDVYPGRLILYEYYMGLNSRCSLPYPISEVICEDWKHLKKLGVEGATVQCWTSNHRTYVLNNLAFARCGWYDDVDHQEVLDDYLLGAYGSAAEAVRPIFEGMLQAVRDRAASKATMPPGGGSRDVGCFLDKIGRDAMHRALAAAQKNAQSEREKRQLEKLAAAVRYWETAADTFELYEQAAALAKTDPQAARKTLDRLLGSHWSELTARNQPTAAPGWICITVPSMWERIKQKYVSLRDELNGRKK